MKILVGIPSLNEADNISFVTKAVDASLSKYFPGQECVILNVDSASIDDTPGIFNKTPTTNPKHSIVLDKEGKGRNIKALLEYMISNNIDYGCMVDSDLRSITNDWVFKLIDPLTQNIADYVVPIYERNKYDGNSTNHFCYPLISELYQTPIRQPIAGEFGFSYKFAKYLLDQSWPNSAYGYGIDIFMSLYSVIGGFRIKETYLGQKLHNPSFAKQIPRFIEVATSMFTVIKNQDPRKLTIKSTFIPEGSEIRKSIGAITAKPSNESIKEKETGVMRMISEHLENKKSSMKLLLSYFKDKYLIQGNISGSDWMFILAYTLRILFEECETEKDIEVLVIQMTPLNILRIVSYFMEISDLQSNEVEEIIEAQRGYLREYYRSLM